MSLSINLSKSLRIGNIFQFAFVVILLLLSVDSSAQKLTTIRGKVFDAKTKQALPFVDVVLKGTYVGVSTDLDGQYLIQTRNPSDTVQVSFIGYHTIEQKISTVPITCVRTT